MKGVLSKMCVVNNLRYLTYQYYHSQGGPAC